MKMSELPFTEAEREDFRKEFPGFDHMTHDEFKAAYFVKMDEMLDTYNLVNNHQRRGSDKPARIA